jgi:hypothetical protein
MLGSLHIKSIKLVTNNPEKIKDLQSHGVKITGRVPIIIEPNKYNAFYLETKRLKGGHLLDKNMPEIIMEHQDEMADHNKANGQKPRSRSPA